MILYYLITLPYAVLGSNVIFFMMQKCAKPLSQNLLLNLNGIEWIFVGIKEVKVWGSSKNGSRKRIPYVESFRNNIFLKFLNSMKSL